MTLAADIVMAALKGSGCPTFVVARMRVYFQSCWREVGQIGEGDRCVTKNEGKEITQVEHEARRAFVKTATKAAIVAPAVVLLLNAATKPAAAQSFYQPLTPDVMVHPIRG